MKKLFEILSHPIVDFFFGVVCLITVICLLFQIGSPDPVSLFIGVLYFIACYSLSTGFTAIWKSISTKKNTPDPEDNAQ